MTRSLVIIIVAFGLALGAAGAVLARWEWHRSPSATALETAEGSGIGRPLYSLDARDDRAMAAYATDIFIGMVLGQTGAIGAPTSAPGQEMPQSQFAVEVLHTVKGKAAGVVTINQVGGLDAQAGQMMHLDGDAPLRPGRSELFLVVQVPELDWYQIVAAGHGHLPAVDPIDRAALVGRFTEALATAAMEGPSSSSRHYGERS